ncbi:glycosyltransferase family 2 protein [Halopelagius fulvigenes]|uniref:Glycosyltransferase family 2 protein n=1 Tax=Halopelagius fulvigenes TaxID=1198324 RepID=A0ABD5TUW3_9EURY
MTDTAHDPLVSVVVTTYYRNDRLREALSSVRDQTHRPVECIVVDGSEEGHARSVVESFDADSDLPVTYVPQERDEGPHAARSVGAERASGEYVQFLDDDDRLRPEKFARQLPRFSEDVGVVYSGLRDEEWGVVEPQSDVRGDVLEHALKIRTFPAIPSTMLVDRRVLEEILPLRHRHGADDSGMKIELARRTRFDFVDAPLVVRGKPPGESVSDSWDHIRGRRLLVNYYDDEYGAFPPHVRRTAVRQTDYRAGRKRLEESPWDPRATLSLARAAAETPEDTPRFAATALASVFGRPGVELADRAGIAP